MESQLQRPSDGQHGHHHHEHEDGGTHSMVVGGEKKSSVLKKVKDKAKKIKDTIKKHGHRDRHDHDDQQQEHKVQGAPMLESTVVKETKLEKPENDHHRVTDKGDNQAALAPENKNALPSNKAQRLGDEDPHSPNNTPTPTSNNNRSTPTPTPTPTGDSTGGADQDSPKKPVSASASASEYAHKLAGTVYEKVAGAGSAVISKSNGGESVKEYLSEKLKPGDEDKALSQAITGALHKRDPEEPQPQPPPRAKVTVSKEVAERLGTDRESKREGAMAAGEESSGNGFVERLENAVTSWFSNSDGIQTAQDSLSNAFVNNPSSASGGVEQTP